MIIAIATLLLWGCGSKSTASKTSSAVAESAAKVKESAPRRIVESGKLTLTASNPDGSMAWKVNGESSRAGLQEGGDQEFFIDNASGEIYENGELASTFTANSAKAATETKKLVLDGNVKITSLGKNAVVASTNPNNKTLSLKADKITWMEDKQLFAASGNVSIDSPDYQLGNMDEVWATRDLSKIGTPNKFK